MLKPFLRFTVLALLFAAQTSSAQEDKTSKKRLRSPATVRGVIGGESHDGYVIHARKGQTLTVQISWQTTDGNRAEFTVSQSANFFNAVPVPFGATAEEGKRWSGRIPRTGNYYIYAVGHPVANYTLRVALK